MSDKTETLLPQLLIVIVVLVIVVVVLGSDTDWTMLKNRNLSAPDLAGLVLGLVAVALFIERAAQVYLGITRGEKSANLRQKLTAAKQQVEETTTALERMATKEAATQNEKAEIGNYMVSLEAQKTVANTNAQELASYRAGTARWALTINLILGLLVATVAARSLGPMFDWTGCSGISEANCSPITPSSWFTLVDILITGALLGGGADGLNKIISVFTAYAEEAKSKVQNI